MHWRWVNKDVFLLLHCLARFKMMYLREFLNFSLIKCRKVFQEINYPVRTSFKGDFGGVKSGIFNLISYLSLPVALKIK